jgi:tRNA (mo5U34)-methyltransferase
VTAADLRRRVDAIRWFHTIDLGHGIVTPGEDDSPRKLARLRLPASLAGRTVLDVGAMDGFFAFEAERRGAARVVAVDPASWRTSRAGFDLAHAALRSRVEAVTLDSLDELDALGTFDVVLFLGVLYHLPDPWPVLARVAALATERLVVETHADLLDTPVPGVVYYPGAEVDGDASNFWGPNVAMLVERLRDAGFARLRVRRERLPYRAARAAYRRLRGSRYGVHQGRLVVHALRA